MGTSATTRPENAGFEQTRRPASPHVEDAGLANCRQASCRAPRAGSEIGGGEPAQAYGGHLGSLLRRDLGWLAQTLGYRHHGREPEAQPLAAVVDLAVQRQGSLADLYVANVRGEGKVEKLGDLGTDLSGVGIDRAATD